MPFYSLHTSGIKDSAKRSIKYPHMSFADTILPHLDAAYNLACWLTKSQTDAGDVVQESMVRAMKYFGGYRGGDSRAWILAIVRNTSYSWLQRQRSSIVTFGLDEDLDFHRVDHSTPETLALSREFSQRVQAALYSLPLEFREVIVLRELEGLAYKEISQVVGVPIGTVMSRLARGRERLQESLASLRNPI